jgi:hypothetical protein
MPHLTLRGLRPVFDFREQGRFDPDSPVRDPLGIGLRFSDQRFETRLEILRGDAVEAVVDLSCVDKIRALEAAQVKPVELVFLEREAGDRQRLSLRAGLLDPVVASA